MSNAERIRHLRAFTAMAHRVEKNIDEVFKYAQYLGLPSARFMPGGYENLSPTVIEEFVPLVIEANADRSTLDAQEMAKTSRRELIRYFHGMGDR